MTDWPRAPDGRIIEQQGETPPASPGTIQWGTHLVFEGAARKETAADIAARWRASYGTLRKEPMNYAPRPPRPRRRSTPHYGRRNAGGQSSGAVEKAARIFIGCATIALFIALLLVALMVVGLAAGGI